MIARVTKLVLIALTGVLVASGGIVLCLDGLAEEEPAWPLFRGSPDMRGVAGEVLKAPLKLAWAVELGDSVLATPVIAGGRVYVGAEDGKFACFNLADGVKLWEYLAEDKIEGTACVAGAAVVFGSGDGLLHAVDRESGKVIWTYETDGEILGGANLYHSDKDGTDYVLIGSYDNNLHCVNLVTGKAKWTYETDNAVNGAPGVHAGKIYFGGCDAQIYSVDAETGKTGSSMDAENYIANSIVVVDAVAYVAHHGNRVAAFDLVAKKRLWEFGERDFPFFASPAVSADSVFAAGRDKRLYRIDRKTGEAVWEFKTGSGIDSSPVVSGDTVFVGSGDGNLYAIDIPGGEKVWSYEIGEDIRSSPAIAGGKLVIGCDDGKVYAFSSAVE
jgi:outer membrane protein assembly factor BamB